MLRESRRGKCDRLEDGGSAAFVVRSRGFSGPIAGNVTEHAGTLERSRHPNKDPSGNADIAARGPVLYHESNHPKRVALDGARGGCGSPCLGGKGAVYGAQDNRTAVAGRYRLGRSAGSNVPPAKRLGPHSIVP